MGGGHRSLDWFCFRHVALFEKVEYVALLGENEAFGGRGSFHTEEIMKGT
jgi:hypothetical protein